MPLVVVLFYKKTPNETWALFEHLSENSELHDAFLCQGTSKQARNSRGLYEISCAYDAFDLSYKVDVLSKKFDQFMTLNKVNMSPYNVQDACTICASPMHFAFDCSNASQCLKFL